MKTKEKIKTGQATHEEICDQALTDYERISSEVCDWNSVIPKAIEFYKNKDKLLSLQKQEIVEEILDFLKDQKEKHYSTDLIVQHLKAYLKQILNN